MTDDGEGGFSEQVNEPIRGALVKDTAMFRRNAVALCLVLAPALMLVSSALQPPFVEGYADRLADIAEAGTAAWVSNALFIVTQAPMLVSFLGLAHLLRGHSPRLSVLIAVLGVLATFGEAVMGGTGLVYLTMAGDAGNREVFAGVWEQMESSPVMMFAMVGFGGTVLTLVLVSIGLFRSRIVPRWVPVLVWLFIVLEFFGSALTEYASYAAGLCLLIAFGTIARLVAQGPRAAWEPLSEWGACASSSPARPASSGPTSLTGSGPTATR